MKNMENKQTALDWLVIQVNSDCLNSTFIRKELIDQAKAMEKEQIVESYEQAYINMNMAFRGADRAEQYYNETYGK